MDLQLTLLPADEQQTIDNMFENWLLEQRPVIRHDSGQAYRSIWHSYAGFLLQFGYAPETIDASSLTLFIDEIEPRAGAGETVSPRYAWRVIDLVDKVTRYAAKRAGTQPNQAAAALLASERFRYVNARDNEPLPQTLDATGGARLVKQLTNNAELIGLRSTWKLERDRTALALMLGSGITPLEVRSLTLSDIYFKTQRGKQSPWKIRVSATAKTVEHDAPIAHWARRCLLRWIEARNGLNLTHQDLFPATLNRPGWTDISCQISCTNTLTTLIGEEYRHGGLLRLRHTFIIRQLQRGIPLEKIALWLGLRTFERLERYKRIMVRDEFVA